MRTQRSPIRFSVLTSLGLSSSSRSYSLIAGSIFPFATSFSALAMTLSRWTAIVSVSPEQKHRLIHPFERFPMDRARTVQLQSRLMLLGRVTPMMSEPVDGVAVMIRLHQEIAVDLRHDGGGGDGDAAAVAFDQGDLGHLQRLDSHGVEQQDIRTD